MIKETFNLNPERIKVENILSESLEGKIVLPEFQRDFVWGAEDIRELIASIMGGYFIGTLLVHENTKEKTFFALKPLPFTGKETEDIPSGSIIKIILDGQQRLASLIYALTSPEVPLKKNKYPHKFFLNLRKLFKTSDILESIEAFSMNPTNKNKYLKYEYSHLKQQNKNLESIKYIDLSILSQGQDAIDDLFDDLRELNWISKDNAQQVRKLLRKFLEYEIIYIKIPQDVSIEVIVEIFERINKTSYKLSTVDLLFAKLYKELNRGPRELILDKIRNLKQEYKEFEDLLNELLVIKIILLLSDKELKPKSIISLEAKDLNNWLNFAVKGIEKALNWLIQEAGVRKNLLPYTTLLIPLGSSFAYLEFLLATRKLSQEKKGDLEREVRDFIKAWYWTNVLSERYEEGASSKAYQDFKQFKQFIDNLLVNSKIEIKFPHIRLEVFKERKPKNSAIVKAFKNLLILNNVRDWETGELWNPSFSEEHIFPKSKYGKEADIVLNRTLLASQTNKYIKNSKSPSDYFKKLEKKVSTEKFLEILNSHFINDTGLEALKNENFKDFIENRLQELKKFLERKLKLGKFIKR